MTRVLDRTRRGASRPRAALVVALIGVSVVAAGCGSSAPNVSGAAASNSTTLFKASNLSKVLSQADGQLHGASVILLKVEPQDVKITGQGKSVTVDNTGKSFVVNIPSIPGQAGFSLSLVSPATVEKVVSAVEAKANLKQTDIAYVTVTVDPTNNKPYYGVYPVNGTTHYQADINGANVKSYGGSSAPTPATGAPSSTKTPGGGAASNAQSIASCVAKAGTDPAKIAKCTGG